MHGLTSPTIDDVSAGLTKPGGRMNAWLRRQPKWLLAVVLPTLLLAIYYYGFASDQYESEAHFMVRSAEPASPTTSGLGQALSLVGGVSTTQADALSVSDYLTSHDAVAALRRDVDLVARFHRLDADLLSRLRPADPTPETLLRYYRSMVKVTHDSETGITTLKVRGFRPKDSYAIVNQLLALGEGRVNALNIRAYQNTLRSARRQLAESEQAVAQSQRALTRFRQVHRNIDPKLTGEAQVSLVSGLQARLAQTRAQRSAMAGSISPSSPQAQAVARQVRALETQVAAESGRLTGGANNIAANLGNYLELELRQEFAAKRYEATAAALQKAREQAQRQQLYVVRIVEPNMPVKSLYPKRLKIIATVFFTLLLVYCIGWLIAAGMREHAS